MNITVTVNDAAIQFATTRDNTSTGGNLTTTQYLQKIISALENGWKVDQQASATESALKSALDDNLNVTISKDADGLLVVTTNAK